MLKIKATYVPETGWVQTVELPLGLVVVACEDTKVPPLGGGRCAGAAYVDGAVCVVCVTLRTMRMQPAAAISSTPPRTVRRNVQVFRFSAFWFFINVNR